MSNIKNYTSVLQNILKFNQRQFIFSFGKTTAAQIDELEKTEEYETVPAAMIDEESDFLEKEAIIESKRNVSRLLPQHRNMLYEELPYNEPQSWIHETEKYKRMMFGRLGLKSGVDPRICWPNKSDLKEKKEYEKIAYPFSLQEMIKMNEKTKKEKADAIQLREDTIAKKLEKLEVWKNELNAKIAKKESTAKEAKDRKDRLVEEVRRHFGYKVDPRDDRFKELLEQKEREDRKRLKEEKRKVKEAKMITKLVGKNEPKSEPVVT